MTLFRRATAAYQAEGATKKRRRPVAWDEFLEKQEDSALIRQVIFTVSFRKILNYGKFGINGIRLSIAWTRIFLTARAKSIRKVLITIIVFSQSAINARLPFCHAASFRYTERII